MTAKLVSWRLSGFLQVRCMFVLQMQIFELWIISIAIFGCDFRSANLNYCFGVFGISCEIILSWMGFHLLPHWKYHSLTLSHGFTLAVTTAKGIGNGFPLAAVITTPAIANSMSKALHFNTFGGNPLACAVGSKVLDVSNYHTRGPSQLERRSGQVWRFPC